MLFPLQIWLNKRWDKTLGQAETDSVRIVYPSAASEGKTVRGIATHPKFEIHCHMQRKAEHTARWAFPSKQKCMFLRPALPLSHVLRAVLYGTSCQTGTRISLSHSTVLRAACSRRPHWSRKMTLAAASTAAIDLGVPFPGCFTFPWRPFFLCAFAQNVLTCSAQDFSPLNVNIALQCRIRGNSVGIATGYSTRPTQPPLQWLWGREADHSPPPCTEVRNGGTLPPLPPYVCMA
jgi:hypothetical protein